MAARRVQSGPLRRASSGPRQTKQATVATSGTLSRMTSSAESARSDGGKIKLTFSEVRGDLFDCRSTASLAHCVSEDLHMGRGIAKEFKKRFEGAQELKTQGRSVCVHNIFSCKHAAYAGIVSGGVAVLERGDRCIFYLVCFYTVLNNTVIS